MILRISLLALVTSGCATSYDTVRETVSNAPDWYDTRKADVMGEGYPRIGSIPSLSGDDRRPDALRQTRTAVERAEALFRMDPRAVPPGLELAEMIQWAKTYRARLAALDEPGDFLSHDEAEALRERFNLPPAQS